MRKPLSRTLSIKGETEAISPLCFAFSSVPIIPVTFFLVPKPRLGNASAPEAPASAVSRHGKPGSFPGKCVPKPGLGNEKRLGPGSCRNDSSPEIQSECTDRDFRHCHNRKFLAVRQVAAEYPYNGNHFLLCDRKYSETV